MILDWRNSERVRVNMFNDHVIGKDEHDADRDRHQGGVEENRDAVKNQLPRSAQNPPHERPRAVKEAYPMALSGGRKKWNQYFPGI